MKPEILERLKEHNIRLHAKSKNFCAFTRIDCRGVVIWDEETQIFESPGRAGISTDQGLGYLITKDGQYLLEGNTFLEPPSEEQLAKIQQFHADLKACLGLAD